VGCLLILMDQAVGFRMWHLTIHTQNGLHIVIPFELDCSTDVLEGTEGRNRSEQVPSCYYFSNGFSKTTIEEEDYCHCCCCLSTESNWNPRDGALC